MSVRIILSAEAHAFVIAQPIEARNKIDANIRRIENGIISKDLFKKIKGTDIWELRTLYGGIAYRIMAFWDKQQQSLVIATHGFVKKTQKTPEKEIAKAISIMKEYYNNK
ncbi:MAG: type II toxin-antitoxin system RelE/ParE family toxin [Bacteroidales bacterium]|nr:type II toxin-antitoxin system RelE/ParE family toxin [Bacteroidales bacterium]